MRKQQNKEILKNQAIISENKMRFILLSVMYKKIKFQYARAILGLKLMFCTIFKPFETFLCGGNEQAC